MARRGNHAKRRYVGWVMAILLPIVRVILGIIAAARGEGGQGAGTFAVSLLAFIVWSAVLAPAAFEEGFNSGF